MRSVDPGTLSCTAAASIDEGDGLVARGRYEDAIACYDAVVERLGETDRQDLRKLVRIALAKKGAALVNLDRFDEADVAFDAWCMRTRDAVDPERSLVRARESIGRILLKRAYELSNAGQHKLAIVAADALLDRFIDDPPPDRLDLVADGLRRKAFSLADLGRAQEGIALLSELVERYNSVKQPAVQKAITRAMNKKAELLAEHGRISEALEVYNELLARIGDTDVRRPYEELDALMGKAQVLNRLRCAQEVIATTDRIVRLYGDDPDDHVRESVAHALDLKASILLHKGSYEDVIQVEEELLVLIGRTGENKLCRYVAHGFVRQALALGNLGRLDEVVAVADEASERFGDTIQAESREAVGRLLDLKALALRKLGELERSAAVWSKVAERYGDDEAPEMRNLVRQALTQKAEVLTMLGRGDEAIVVADGLIDSSGATETEDIDPKKLSHVADVLIAKGTALAGEERYEEAVQAFDELIDRSKDAQEPGLRRSIAIALNGKVAALDRLDWEEESYAAFEQLASCYAEEALVIFDETAKHFATATVPEAREAAASALYSKAYILGKLGRDDEALLTLDDLTARFADDENENIKMIVADAHAAREGIASDGHT
jgi:tetratricopeptide (TPR) repeat protein